VLDKSPISGQHGKGELKLGTINPVKSSQDNKINERMSYLSSLLYMQSELFQSPVVLLDSPVYSNVGDLLIWKGEQTYLKRIGSRILGQYSIDNIGSGALVRIDQCRTICLQGGGNFGDLWSPYQEFREKIIQAYPNKRIVIFPQSVHFQDRSSFYRASEILKRHKDLHIMVRDRNSFAQLQEKGLPNLILCPDMAHALWPIVVTHPTLNEPLHLLRDDKEQGYLPESVKRVAPGLDWNNLVSGNMAVAFKIGHVIDSKDKHYHNMLPACFVWNRVSQMLINRAVKLFTPYRTVISNRLHAIILSTLMSRKAIAYDNSYGKISSYISEWLDDLPDVISLPLSHDLAGLNPT
jgi:pyruvyl transferase EpsO